MRRATAVLTVLVALLGLGVVLWWTPADPDLPHPRPAAAGGVDAPAAAGAELPGRPAAGERVQRVASAADGGGRAPLPNDLATGFRGRVVDGQGAPVTGIDVQLLRLAVDALLPNDFDVFAREPAGIELVVATDRTDGEGRFALLGLPPRGSHGLRLAFAEPETAPRRWRSGQGTLVPVQASPAPGEVVDLGDVRLKNGGTLVGRVVDGDGPLAGALVRAAVLPPLPFAAVPIERLRPDGCLLVTAGGSRTVLGIPAWLTRCYELLPFPQALTAADGTFTLHAVDPGAVVVAVTAPRHDSLVRQGIAVAAGATVALGDLQLGDGSSATVAVVDAAGQPVVGAEVVVAPLSVGVPVHIGEPAGTTGADGKVVLDGLPRGRAQAAARRSPDDAWQVGEPGPADGTLRVVVPARHRLLLTVTDNLGRVLRDVQVRAAAGTANAGAVELALVGLGHTVDLGRRLQRLEDGRLVIADLDAGEWTFVLRAPGCSTRSVDVALRSDLERTVVLPAARSLRVRTVDAAGAPVAGARLQLRPRGGSRAERVVELPLPVGATAVDGWCTIADLPTTEALLTAVHPAHGQVHATVSAPTAELVLAFAAPGTIRGVLTDGGRPPAPGRWVLVLERRYGDAPGERRGALPDLPQLTLPGLDGAFTFAALQPGKYRVTAQDALADVGTVAGMVQYAARREQILPWNKAEVELHGGEVHDVRLDAILDAPPYDGPGAAVRGMVTVNSAPAVGAVVVASSKRPDRRVTSRVDRAGAFDLGRCPAGEIRVVVVPNDVADSRLKENLFSHHWARDLQVVDGQPLELAIDVVTGGVFGDVRDRDGRPLDECRVMLFDRGGDGRSSALRVVRTDGRGAFAFRDLPVGSYEVRAEKDKVGRVTLPPVQVGEGAPTGPVAIVLVPFAAVEGRVETTPGMRVHVQLLPAVGDPLQTLSEPGGAFRFDAVPHGSYRVQLRLGREREPRSGGRLEVGDGGVKGVLLRPGG